MQESLVATHVASPQKLSRTLSRVLRFMQHPSRHGKDFPGTHSKAPSTNPKTWPIKHRIPKDAWDSHMHVIDDKYEFAANAVYKPSTHTLDDALIFESLVGIRNIVLVQPSIYGNDNSCLLAALETIGTRRARGVVAFDPETTSQSQLQEWHEKGVRGVRLNISSNGRKVELAELESLLRRYADAVRPLNWVVQVYIPMALIAPLESIVPSLNVRFCIDHLGHPSLKEFGSIDPYELPGFPSLVRLVKGGHVFVKLSAPYRLSQLDDQSNLEPVAKEIIRVGGKSRVVFATDWPHTRFEGLDIRPFMERVINWCSDDEVLVDRLFRGNAEDLWSVTRN